MQAIALKVRSEGKEYKRQPLKAARGNVAAVKAPAAATATAATKYANDVDAGTRPEQPVQVRSCAHPVHRTMHLQTHHLIADPPWETQPVVNVDPGALVLAE